MAERPKCETCRFKGWTGSQFYDCRRRAPIAVDEPRRRGGVTEPHWPMVEAHHWCGDHEVDGTQGKAASVLEAEQQQQNQCDGCARGLPVNEFGNHRGPGAWDVQGCTADRYRSPAPEAGGHAPQQSSVHQAAPGGSPVALQQEKQQ